MLSNFRKLPFRLVVGLLQDHFILELDEREDGKPLIFEFFGTFSNDRFRKIFLLCRNVEIETIPDDWNDIPVRELHSVSLQFGIPRPKTFLENAVELQRLDQFYPITSNDLLPPKLEELQYVCESLNGEEVRKINELKNLKKLQICTKSFDESPEIFTLNNIKEMKIVGRASRRRSSTAFRSGSSYFPNEEGGESMGKLKKLHIAGNWELSGDLIEILTKLPSLEELYLSHCEVLNLKQLISNSRIKHLTIRNSKLCYKDVFINEIFNTSKVKKIVMYSCENRNEEDLDKFGLDDVKSYVNRLGSNKKLMDFAFFGVVGDNVTEIRLKKEDCGKAGKFSLKFGTNQERGLFLVENDV